MNSFASGVVMNNKKHDIKLFIINSYGTGLRKFSAIASLFGVTEDYVFRCFRELNISPKSKPEHCRG